MGVNWTKYSNTQIQCRLNPIKITNLHKSLPCKISFSFAIQRSLYFSIYTAPDKDFLQKFEIQNQKNVSPYSCAWCKFLLFLFYYFQHLYFPIETMNHSRKPPKTHSNGKFKIMKNLFVSLDMVKMWNQMDSLFNGTFVNLWMGIVTWFQFSFPQKYLLFEVRNIWNYDNRLNIYIETIEKPAEWLNTDEMVSDNRKA